MNDSLLAEVSFLLRSLVLIFACGTVTYPGPKLYSFDSRDVLSVTWSAYHLNEIFGENVSTNGTARSVLRKRKWESAVLCARKTGCFN